VAKLTPYQKNASAEIKEIAAITHIVPDAVCNPPSIERTEALDLLRMKLVTAEVIRTHTLIDEILSSSICEFHFSKGFGKEWKKNKPSPLQLPCSGRTLTSSKTSFCQNYLATNRETVRPDRVVNCAAQRACTFSFPREFEEKQAGVERLCDLSFEGIKRFSEDTDDLVSSLWKITKPY
jgi:hypothetical protein